MDLCPSLYCLVFVCFTKHTIIIGKSNTECFNFRAIDRFKILTFASHFLYIDLNYDYSLDKKLQCLHFNVLPALIARNEFLIKSPLSAGVQFSYCSNIYRFIHDDGKYTDTDLIILI